MGRGDDGAIGVVHGAEAKKPVGDAVVSKPVPFRRPRRQLFPWDSHDSAAQKIPWVNRTYTFQWTNGGVTVLPEDWSIETDGKGRIQQLTKSPVPFANHLGFPEISFAQAKEMERLSATTGCSLKVAFAKVVDMGQLSDAVQEKIALAPEMFANPSQEKVVEQKKKDIKEAFWKQVKTELPKPAD